jgi:hypothetical protein
MYALKNNTAFFFHYFFFILFSFVWFWFGLLWFGSLGWPHTYNPPASAWLIFEHYIKGYM